MEQERATVEFAAGSAKRTQSQHGSRDNLAMLYQGFFTGIVRLQAKRQPLGDSEAFRARMRTAMRDIEREAAALGYSAEDVRDAEFAIVAFLDEVVLASDDPGRDRWAKKTLGVEMFGEAVAGELFFERLESLKSRRDSDHLADLLEVYSLCLLLGFEGRYTGMPGEIHATIDRARRRIDAIRQRDSRLTPEAAPESPGAPVAMPMPNPDRWRRTILIAAGIALAIFLLMKLNLVWMANQISRLIGE